MKTCHNPLDLVHLETLEENAREVLFAVALLAAANSFTGDIPLGQPFSGARASIGIVPRVEPETRDTPLQPDHVGVPNAPASHWLAVDSKGHVYML